MFKVGDIVISQNDLAMGEGVYVFENQSVKVAWFDGFVDNVRDATLVKATFEGRCKAFGKELLTLYKKYNLCIQSEDPYCGLEFTDYNDEDANSINMYIENSYISTREL